MRAVLASPNARLCLGEKTIFSPSFGTPPRSGVWSLQCRYNFFIRFVFVVRFNVPSESALAEPPLLSFQYKYCGVASATKLCFATQLRRSPEILNAIAEIARRRRNSYVLAPNPPVRTQF